MAGSTEKISGSKRYIARLLLLCMVLAAGFAGLPERKAAAAGSYQVRINKQQNCVTIYRADSSGEYKPVKAMVCSTGYATKLGTFSLGEKMRWHTLDGPCYGQYCTRIYGGVLFHSVWYSGYNNPATLSVSSYNRLGTTASHGCVRLCVRDAKWIYDNVPSGTTVIIYSDSNPGPLGKPVAIKVPYSVPWDPTDIWTSGNPWNNKKPSLTVVKKQIIEYGADFDIMKGVSAKNTTGYDAKALVKTKIKYDGETVSKVDTETPGIYKIVYSLTDEIDRKATAKATVKVTGEKEKPVITGAEDFYVKAKSKLKKNFMLKGVTVTQGGKALPKQYVTVTLKKVKTNVYKVTYTAKRASEPAKVQVKAYVDKKAPVIKGVEEGKVYEVDKSTKVNKTYARNLITQVSDNVSKVKKTDVKIAITKSDKDGGYKVVYTLKDQAGNQCRMAIYLVPMSYMVIEGPDSIQLGYEDLSCEEDVPQSQLERALKAYLLNKAGYKVVSEENTDATELLTVELTKTGDFTYTAHLSATDKNNRTVSRDIAVTIVPPAKDDGKDEPVPGEDGDSSGENPTGEDTGGMEVDYGGIREYRTKDRLE